MNGAHEVRLLRDEPGALPTIGGHAAVAKSIASMIAHEDGGITIGLEGSWGSGKSTIVHELSSELPDNVKLFVFDAWAHEGDPLRRSFLETLTLRLEPWLKDPVAWDAELNKLARRERSSEQTSTQRLTTFGQYLSLAAVGTPIGGALLANELGANPSDRRALALFVAITALPVIVFVAYTALSLLRRSKPGYALLTSTQIIHQESNTIETPDPTSVEFQDAFRLLLKDALSDPGRKLVIVLDNIDRVSPSEALQLLSTLQAFIAVSHDPLWEGRLWVLLPYDADGFRSLWSMGGQNPAIGDEFLAKIRQVRFEAPPLVDSEWRVHLAGLVAKAIPSLTPDEVERASTVFAVDIATRATPTPRKLLQYANNLGAILRQRNDLPVEDVAAYVAIRSESSVDVADGLRDGGVPPAHIERVASARVRESLAALHFGTDVDTAQQLLLDTELLRALLAGDAPRLTNLAANPGFVEVFERLPDRDLQANGAEGLGLAASALSEAGLLAKLRGAVLPNLRYAATDLEEIRLESVRAGHGLATLLRAAGFETPEQVAPIVAAASHQTEDVLAEEVRQAEVLGLVGFIEGLGDPLLGDATIILPGNAKAFVSSCADAAEHASDPSSVLPRLRSSVPASKITEYLVDDWVGIEPDDERSTSALSNVLASATRPSSRKIFEQCIAYLDDPGRTAEQGAALFAIDIVQTLATESYLRSERVKQYVETGHLHNLLELLAAAEDSGRAAVLGLLAVSTVPALPDPPVVGSSAEGVARLRSWLTHPSEHASSERLRNLIATVCPGIIPGISTQHPDGEEWCRLAADDAAERGAAAIWDDLAEAWTGWKGLLSSERWKQILGEIIASGRAHDLLERTTDDRSRGELELDMLLSADPSSSGRAKLAADSTARLAALSDEGWLADLTTDGPAASCSA